MPNLQSVSPRDVDRVRVTFDSALADQTDGPTGALNPDNWSTTPTDAIQPQADAQPALIERVSDTEWDVIAETEFSFGKQYKITAENVLGVMAPNNEAAFVSIDPPQPALRRFALWDMIPGINRREDDTGDLRKFVDCLQDVVDVLLHSVDRWTDILDPDLAPKNFIDRMLEDLGNPFTFINLSTLEKRRLVQLLVPIAKQKGTAVGIINSIRLLAGFESQVLIHNTTGSLIGKVGTPRTKLGKVGSPGTLRLGSGSVFDFSIQVATEDAYGRTLTAAEENLVRAIANIMKPAHLVLRVIRVGVAAPDRIKIEDAGGGDITLTWDSVPGATKYFLHSRTLPDTTQFNSTGEDLGAVTTETRAAGGSPTFYVTTGGGATFTGLHSNEVTDGLTAPGAPSATPGQGKITLDWSAVTGATQYRIYRRDTTGVDPLNGDILATVDGDVLTYDDVVPSGSTYYYVIAPIDRGAEGFYSSEVTATSG